jgi:hypothetical protein
MPELSTVFFTGMDFLSLIPGTVVVVIVWLLDLQLPMQLVGITTNVVS